MRGRNDSPVRTVVVPTSPPLPLLSALLDVRSAVNHLVVDWRNQPEESRFDATKRCYPDLREHYPHLAATWAVVMCNEASASLRAWDRHLRHWKRHDPTKWERLRLAVPRRHRLKASLHLKLYRLRDGVLDITIAPDRHVRIDVSHVTHPLFAKYLGESKGDFGLAVSDRALIFNFHVPHDQPVVGRSAGIDVNMPSADFATSDGSVGSVDLVPITRIQGAMQRKRQSIQERIPKDLRLQRMVLRRSRGRERHRVEPLLHRAANELLDQVGNRNVVLEDLSDTQEDLIPTIRNADARRRLSRWTQGELQRIVAYKAHTAVLHVDPRGTSSTCPRCGGQLDHPEWRRSDCGACQNSWHRDKAAAIAILFRGIRVLRGAAPPPRALNALLEASRWGSERGSGREPRKGNEAKVSWIRVTFSTQRGVNPAVPPAVRRSAAPRRAEGLASFPRGRSCRRPEHCDGRTSTQRVE